MKLSDKLRLGTAMLTVLTVGYFGITARADGLSTTDVPHGRLEDFKWVPLPQAGGSQAIIYRSPDGKRVAAAFKESGKVTFTFPFDEFFYVISGRIKITVHGGPTFEVKQGGVGYIKEGQTIDCDFGKDFYGVSFLVSDHDTQWPPTNEHPSGYKN
jgi:uncharacterized cupin superfamily protein